MDRIKDSTPRKLSVELVAVLNRKNKNRMQTKMKVFHPSIVLWVAIVKFLLV